MNKRQAKAYALRVLAAETRHHVSNGSTWLEQPLLLEGLSSRHHGEFSEADARRVSKAVLEVAEELERRARRLLEAT